VFTTIRVVLGLAHSSCTTPHDFDSPEIQHATGLPRSPDGPWNRIAGGKQGPFHLAREGLDAESPFSVYCRTLDRHECMPPGREHQWKRCSLRSSCSEFDQKSTVGYRVSAYAKGKHRQRTFGDISMPRPRHRWDLGRMLFSAFPVLPTSQSPIRVQAPLHRILVYQASASRFRARATSCPDTSAETYMPSISSLAQSLTVRSLLQLAIHLESFVTSVDATTPS
jgi:hypothetical protein